jgi:hypothetical protein
LAKEFVVTAAESLVLPASIQGIHCLIVMTNLWRFAGQLASGEIAASFGVEFDLDFRTATDLVQQGNGVTRVVSVRTKEQPRDHSQATEESDGSPLPDLSHPVPIATIQLRTFLIFGNYDLRRLLARLCGS